jgi:lysine 2,3-aminomutase
VIPKFAHVWKANPDIHALLRRAPNLSAARAWLLDYLYTKEREFYNVKLDVHALEWATILRCLQVMKQIVSVRNEKVSGFSALRLLWLAARRKVDESAASPGFKEEFRHLFRAIGGESRLYTDIAEADPVHPRRLEGREAAIARSDELDRLGAHVEERVARYPTGLDPEVVRRREGNRRRILKALGGTRTDWQDPRWHVRNVIRDAKTLGRCVRLTPDEIESIKLANHRRIPFGVTPHYASLMDHAPHRRNDHSVRAQVIPTRYYVEHMAASRAAGGHSLDFMQEHDTSPVDLVTRRYVHVAILKPYNTCAQICVYCQRNWEIDRPMAPGALASEGQIDAAIEWFCDHPAIFDVLVTGGDPLVTSDNFLDRLLRRLADISHVERIRIGSRVPVTVPQRITPRLVETIARYHEPGRREVCLVTHVQHVYEVTWDTVRAIQAFRQKGMAVYNQMVFTRENSRRFEAVALRRLLRRVGIDPYYTFNTKGKDETLDFRVPIARLRQEQKEGARVMPGLVRTDEAVFNVPGLGKNYLRGIQHHMVIMILPDGRRVYEFHPWEKRIRLAPTHIETDVSIWDYLEWLKAKGEDLKEYRSIWYYY